MENGKESKDYSERFVEILQKADVDRKLIDSLPKNYFKNLSDFMVLIAESVKDGSITGAASKSPKLIECIEFLLDHQELMENESLKFVSSLEQAFHKEEDEEARLVGDFMGLVRDFIQLIHEELGKLTELADFEANAN